MPSCNTRRRSPFFYSLAISTFACWVLYLYRLLNPPVLATVDDPCTGRYVYIHNLPSKFNSDLLADCRSLNSWTDMCLYTSNAGLGPPLPDLGPGWHATNQFSLEVIFHNRMKQYRCLTNRSSSASAIFVPFYAGLEVARHLWGHNTTVRDAAAVELVHWLRSQPEWAAMDGRDHFMVAGRITWDFRRLSDGEPNWGSRLLLLPEARNMTTLLIESSPWHGNDFAIPYPTYFHPSSRAQLARWQEWVRRRPRPHLFSFAGASRPNQSESIRGRLFEQCRSSRRCKLLECNDGSTSGCHSPGRVMELFGSSAFCLQPQGDSYTRRSAFDAMVAGCVPVFFHPGSAYVQYLWHLGREHRRYSVFVAEEEVREGRVEVEEVLEGIGEEEVTRMREEVVGMLPRLVYGDPSGDVGLEGDAFEVSVEGVLRRVGKLRRGDEVTRRYEEQNSWKYELVGSEGPHQWDRFFFFKP